MAVTVAVTSTDITQKNIIIFGTLVLTGVYGGGATNGDPMSFAGLDDIKSTSLPNFVEVMEVPAAGNAPTGYGFLFAPGTTLANGVLIVLQGGAAASNPGAQITQGAAYPAALLAATANIRFRASFSRI